MLYVRRALPVFDVTSPWSGKYRGVNPSCERNPLLFPYGIVHMQDTSKGKSGDVIVIYVVRVRNDRLPEGHFQCSVLRPHHRGSFDWGGGCIFEKKRRNRPHVLYYNIRYMSFGVFLVTRNPSSTCRLTRVFVLTLRSDCVR